MALNELIISKSQARTLQLHAQGLLTPRKKQVDQADVLACIRQMSLLQIDTIHVVARSPYLVLWSRLGPYLSEHLDQLLAQGKIFEYWAHEACFLPIEDYKLVRHEMLSPEKLGWKFNQTWYESQRAAVNQVLQHIKERGPLRSADFDHTPGKAGGWWSWKPEKKSLEVLFTLGELMVARREKFQRVYDLRERVHKTWRDERDLPSFEQVQREKSLNSVAALGVAKAQWIKDYYRLKNIHPDAHPHTLMQQGELLAVKLADSNESVYVHPRHVEALEAILSGELKAKTTRLLSPFDPVVWDRKRAADLFEFEYRIECYTPADKRQYGYFCLPILRNGQLIGRLDAKTHRKEKYLEIIGLWLEPRVKISAALVTDLARCLWEFAQWQACDEVSIVNAVPAALKTQLRAALNHA